VLVGFGLRALKSAAHCIDATSRTLAVSNHFWIAGHTGETVASFAENDHLALGIRVNDARRLRGFWRAR